MMTNIVIQVGIYLALLGVCVKPLGLFMANVYQGRHTFLDGLLRPVERFVYRIAGVESDREMN